MKEKIVYLKRKPTFVENSNTDPQVQEYFNMSYKAVGSYYKDFGRQFGSGLTREETNLLIPEMTGYYPEHDKREFNRSVAEFYKNMNTKVPAEGLRLNIALEKDGPLSNDNFPVKAHNYIVYKHAMGHPEVAESLEEANKYDHKRFYIEDSDSVLKETSELSNKEDAARLEYYRLIDDSDKVNHMLTMLGKTHSKMEDSEKKVLLKEFVTIDKSLNAASNEQRMDHFIALSSDKYLEIKYRIEEMVRVEVLERVGQRILIKETGDEIGKDIKEASLWFRDKGNSQEVNVLIARYKEFKR